MIKVTEKIYNVKYKNNEKIYEKFMTTSDIEEILFNNSLTILECKEI